MTMHDALSHADVARAWKDESFRAQLSDAQRQALPANPAGLIELTDVELDGVAGGRPFQTINSSCEIWTFGCCPPRTV